MAESLPDKQLPQITFPDDMPPEERLLQALPLGENVAEAGRISGYTDTHSHQRMYAVVNSERFQKRIRERYNGNSHLLLSKVGNIEEQVVNRVMQNLDDLPKFRHTLKEIKQATGILQPDTGPAQPTIQVNNIRQLMQVAINTAPATDDDTGENVIDVDISDS